MKNIWTKSMLGIATLFLVVGCNSDSNDDVVSINGGNGNGSAKGNGQMHNHEGNSSKLPTSVESALNGEKSALSEELANTISYMGNEERLAYDVYNRLYDQWGTKQHHNIATNSEFRHITAVQQLVQKYKMDDTINFTNIDKTPLGYMNTPIAEMEAGTYDISKIQDLYDALVSKGLKSEKDALEVGCMVEVTDIDDLDRYLEIANESNASDVVEVFTFLRKGSYNHYWAFDRGLKNRGVSEGCCSLGTIDGVNYCHPEYPQKEK